MKVLKLSGQGLPQSWISLEQAVLHYAAEEVRWESGAEVAVFRGGTNAITGRQSTIAISSIIGTKGVPNINPFRLKPSLTNSKLFVRDRFICKDPIHSSLTSGFLAGVCRFFCELQSNNTIPAYRDKPHAYPRIRFGADGAGAHLRCASARGYASSV